MLSKMQWSLLRMTPALVSMVLSTSVVALATEVQRKSETTEPALAKLTASFEIDNEMPQLGGSANIADKITVFSNASVDNYALANDVQLQEFKQSLGDELLPLATQSAQLQPDVVNFSTRAADLSVTQNPTNPRGTTELEQSPVSPESTAQDQISPETGEPGQSTDSPAPASQDQPSPAPDVTVAEDKTGTNPLNFRNEFRLLNEFRDLQNGNSQNLTTFRFAQPFANRKAVFRIDVPLVYTDIAIDLPEGVSQVVGVESVNIDDFGLGDILARVNYVLYVSKKFGLLIGSEFYFPTASKPTLGTEKWVAGPLVVTAFFLTPKLIFAPAYEHQFSFAGDDARRDIHRGILDLYLVYQLSRTNWIILDPTIVLDYENEQISATMELEAGQIISGGTSVYLRPGFGIGDARFYDFNIESGIKVIW